MAAEIPAEGTLEMFDYLLDGLEGEIRLSERYAIDLDSVAFYKGLLRAAYQQAFEHFERGEQGKQREHQEEAQ